MAATVATVLGVGFYANASARAVFMGGYNFAAQVLHPWETVGLTVAVLVCCFVAREAAGPVLRRGTRLQRIGAGFALVLPAFMVGHFLFSAVHAIVWSYHELTAP